jgi:hypothetical protein
VRVSLQFRSVRVASIHESVLAALEPAGGMLFSSSTKTTADRAVVELDAWNVLAIRRIRRLFTEKSIKGEAVDPTATANVESWRLQCDGKKLSRRSD